MVILSDIDSIDNSMITSNFIKNMLTDGYKRITDKDLHLINEYRLKNKLNRITMDQLQDLINDVKNVLIIRENEENPSSYNVYYVNFFIKEENFY